jgi:hypothetical protein
MSGQPHSNEIDDLVFYVDEDGDDFTFYLARDKENTVFSRHAWSALRDRRRFGPAYSSPEKEFSFTEKVTIKRLGEIKATFWKNLKKPQRGSQYRFLLDKMQRTASDQSRRSQTPDEEKKCKRALMLLKKLESGKSWLEEQGELLKPILARALTECIHQDDLSKKRWAGAILKKLTEDENRTLDSLTGEAQRRPWLNLRIIEKAFPALPRTPEDGRALVCRSHNGKYLSVTFRKLKQGGGYEAKKYKPRDQRDEREKNLFSLGEYCGLVYDEVINRTNSVQHAHGLLVVTGSTNSAKSEIARGLIHLYLSANVGQRRRHLVTFEDPVEKPYSANDNIEGHPLIAIELSPRSQGTDYTPRQKETDVGLLKEALQDALRQSPAVVFVGEIRDKEEWDVLLDFAATGHLIVTTSHAGSLVEAMHKIFEARGVQTASDRAEIANKLLAVIHLRSHKIGVPGKDAREKEATVLFPALWRRTPHGVASLTLDGLASLLPHGAMERKDSRKILRNRSQATGPQINSEGPSIPSCLGRTFIIGQLSATRDLVRAFGSTDADKIRKIARSKAIEWDLLGV